MRRAARRSASVLARVVVGMLPASRHDWGEAMLAEIDRIEKPSARWRFAAGCARVALLPPEPEAGRGRSGPGLVLAAVAGVIGLGVYSEVRSSAVASSGDRGPVYTVAATAFCLVLLAGYTMIALRLVRSSTPRARTGRRYGLRAGGVLGATALANSLPLGLAGGVGGVGVIAAVSLACGAMAARSTGERRSGRDAGIWAGMGGGLVLIVGLLSVTFAAPGWFAGDPMWIQAYHDSLSPGHFHDYHAHYATVAGFVMGESSDTALVGGMVWLPMLGLLFGTAGGALAGRGQPRSVDRS